METAIQLFNSPMFGEIRVVEVNDEAYFVGRDVALALGYHDVVSAISQHIDIEDKVKHPIPDRQGFMQNTTLINESGVYSLVFGSKLASAREFKRWVTSEVLPAIRRHGMYATAPTVENMLNDPDTMIQTLLALKSERNKRIEAEQKIEDQAPKVLFADAVTASSDVCLMAELAKIITQNGFEIGQNRLFMWMRENGYLCRRGDYYNQPTQKAIEMGLFKVTKTVISKPNGTVLTNPTTKVTGKGVQYFVNKFLNHK